MYHPAHELNLWKVNAGMLFEGISEKSHSVGLNLCGWLCQVPGSALSLHHGARLGKTFPPRAGLATTNLSPPTPSLIINFHGTIKHFPTSTGAEHTDRAEFIEPSRFGVFCLVGFLKLLTSSGKVPTGSRGPWISPCVWLEHLPPCLVWGTSSSSS